MASLPLDPSLKTVSRPFLELSNGGKPIMKIAVKIIRRPIRTFPAFQRTMAPNQGHGSQKYKKRMKMSTPTSFWAYCLHTPKWNAGKVYCPLQTFREDLALAFDARISGIVWVIFTSYSWLTVTLETMDQLQLTLVTQTISEMKSLNFSAQSSRSFWSG